MKNRKILIIDDDSVCSNSLSKYLTGFGYQCIQIFNSHNLDTTLHQNSFSVVIINLEISSNDSETIIKMVQKTTDAKIILLSHKEDIKKREKFFQKGILDYHLLSNSLDHVAMDIDEAIQRLDSNKKETILLIDDSRLVRSVVTNLLQNRNYKVLSAANAKEGFEIIDNQNISLLILDMELPDIHGIEILERLRKQDQLNNFPILSLSGSDNPSILRQALKKGCSDFLRKPIQYEEFLLKMDLWIKSSKDQRTIKKQKTQIETSFVVLESLVNSTIEAIFMFENNICTQINKETLHLTGNRSKNDIIGKNITDIFPNVSKEHTQELLDDTSDHFFEDHLYTQSGDKLIVQIKEKNVQLADKQLKIIAVMDITSIKQKEKMLNHQTKMASMGEMIGNIAHQWRQPLTAISVSAGGIKLNYDLGMVDEEEIKTELDNIVDNTQFLSSTIEDFQNFLKDDRTLNHFSIQELITKSISIIKANLESHEIHIIQHIDENFQLNGLQNDFIQVLLNIINNAADILKTKDKKLKRLIVIDISKEEENIIINVQDSGGGVPEHIIGKIFEPYFTTKHQSKGTGLGLYMTHQIITNTMLGTISVQNSDFTYDNEHFFGAKFTIKVAQDMAKKRDS